MCGHVLLALPRTWARRLDLMLSACLSRCETWFDAAIRVSGPIYIALAVTLISAVIYVYFTAVLPLTCAILSINGFLHCLLATWLAGNVFFNYYHCVTTNPGSPPDQLEMEHNGGPYGERLTQKAVRWCKKCGKPKPPLAHHCHICNRCILKMDHHCPWMHNCIGFHNYRYFFLFLAYMWMGCAYALLMSSYLLFRPMPTMDMDPIFGVIFTFVLSLAVEMALTVLFGWHIYLVCTAQTTIDFYGNRQKMREARRVGEVWENQYDLGCKRNCLNTFEVSGPWWWLVLLLPRSRPLRGDGIHFPQRDECSNTGAASYSNALAGNGGHNRQNSSLHGATKTVEVVITATSTTTTHKGRQSRERSVNEAMGRMGPDLV